MTQYGRKSTAKHSLPTGEHGHTIQGVIVTLSASYPLQTDVAVVYVCSPVKKTVNFVISGLRDASTATADKIKTAINTLFFNEGTPDGTGKIYLSDINKAIGDVDGTRGYQLVSPTADILLATGELPVLGTVQFP